MAACGQVCLQVTLCSGAQVEDTWLSPWNLTPLISLGAVPHHHLALSVKELTYSSNS